MLNSYIFYFRVALLFFTVAYCANADEVTLINGDRFSGKLMAREGSKMVLRSEYAGVIKIRWDYVRELILDNPALLQLDNGESIRVQRISVEQGAVTYVAPNESNEIEVDAEVVLGLSPETWVLNEKGVWDGGANISIKSESGNGESDFVDLDFKIEYRRRQDRYHARGEWENDTRVKNNFEDIIKTKDEWFLAGGYDYFFTQKRYLSSQIYFESDDLSGLNLRTKIGPMYGYEFYKSRPKNLLFEFGVLWVDENNHEVEDQTFWQPAWHLDFDQYILDRRFQFYHEQFGTVSVSGDDSWVIRSWTGFRIPIRQALQASLEYKVEYDSDPAGVDLDSTESTFRLKLGYNW